MTSVESTETLEKDFPCPSLIINLLAFGCEVFLVSLVKLAALVIDGVRVKAFLLNGSGFAFWGGSPTLCCLFLI